MTNNTLRREFNAWWKAAYEPRLILVAADIGISKNYLVNWKNSKVDLNINSLRLIDKFLNKQMVK